MSLFTLSLKAPRWIDQWLSESCGMVYNPFHFAENFLNRRADIFTSTKACLLCSTNYKVSWKTGFTKYLPQLLAGNRHYWPLNLIYLHERVIWAKPSPTLTGKAHCWSRNLNLPADNHCPHISWVTLPKCSPTYYIPYAYKHLSVESLPVKVAEDQRCI